MVALRGETFCNLRKQQQKAAKVHKTQWKCFWGDSNIPNSLKPPDRTILTLSFNNVRNFWNILSCKFSFHLFIHLDKICFCHFTTDCKSEEEKQEHHGSKKLFLDNVCSGFHSGFARVSSPHSGGAVVSTVPSQQEVLH